MATKTVQIDSDGDVTLICGEQDGDNQQTTRLLVSSAIMSRGSLVFKKLLAPHFKEGHELSANGAVAITLLEDDAKSMQVLCDVLHMNHDTTPASMNADEILRFAEICDKYEAGVKVKPSAEGWFIARLQAAGHSDRIKLLEAAQLLRYEKLVHQISVELIMRSKSGDELPTTLAAARTKAEGALSKAVEQSLKFRVQGKRSSCDKACSQNAMRFESLVMQLDEAKL